MSWDDKGDFEVNKRLIELIFNGAENPRVSKAFPSASEKMSIHSTARVTFADESMTTVNFCTCWGDMGPLIDEHGITLLHTINSYPLEGWVASLPKAPMGTGRLSIRNKNPLRAAAICLIKKLEGEQ